MHLDAVLADLAVVFLSGVLAVLVLGRLGLPTIVGFLVAGFAVGPHALGLVQDVHVIELVAELGVALLLFAIGLEFSFDRLRRIGRFVAIGGALQVGLTIATAVGIALALGVAPTTGVFWGFLTAVSSTAIVLRLLAERREMDAPHGRFVVGVLIFQDLSIVPMMLTVPLLAGQGASLGDLALVMGKAAAVVIGVVLAARWVVPRLLHRAAKTGGREVFVLAVLLVVCGVAWATASMGLSIALGAFLAGIVIAETGFVHQVHAEISPLRDALASLFFVSVGMLLDPAVVLRHPGQIVGIVALLVSVKAVLVVLAVLMMRFPARVAVLSGLTLAQVGEFSFVILKAGQAEGLVTDEQAATFLAASVVTMIATPLVVASSPRLAAGASLLQPLERLLAIRPTEGEEPATPAEDLRDHVIVAGLGRGGRTLVRSLEAVGQPYVAIELDPETVIAERRAGHRVGYGDITSPEVLAHVAHVGEARQVVLLLSDPEASARAARLIRERHPDVPVLLRVGRRDKEAHRAGVGVEVVAEDDEAAVEIVARVMEHSGAGPDQVEAAVATARATRGRSEPGGG